ncbi:MAG: hypothetical protein LBJ77_03180 [Holosporales bacterium]|jgi:hypothetical protein|nr:hypothetical protein [Holosporales bacterium]
MKNSTEDEKYNSAISRISAIVLLLNEIKVYTPRGKLLSSVKYDIQNKCDRIITQLQEIKASLDTQHDQGHIIPESYPIPITQAQELFNEFNDLILRNVIWKVFTPGIPLNVLYADQQRRMITPPADAAKKR